MNKTYRKDIIVIQWIAMLLSLPLVCASYEPTMEILFGGDISFSGVVYYSKKSGNCTYNQSFDQVVDLFKADYIMANLESPFGDIASQPKPLDEKKPVHLLAEPESVYALKFLGVDAVDLANNHFADFGEKSMEKTIETLQENDIAMSGIDYGNLRTSNQVGLWAKHFYPMEFRNFVSIIKISDW